MLYYHTYAPWQRLLSYSIKSVLSLGRDDVEIIVTIDGSLDCQEYANQVAKQINYASSEDLFLQDALAI